MSVTLLCIATYHKGDEFLRECRRQGCRVLLVTEEVLALDADLLAQWIADDLRGRQEDR